MVTRPVTHAAKIRRLAELGFITLDDDPESRHQLIGIDFHAIETDFEEVAID
ncbi:MAG: hypothetical protein OXU64_09960 [Gemmatimonadota bacterium]|nr:hypothetical protein [Gemmatimonadota bacterium]